jgi:hypothetical protein
MEYMMGEEEVFYDADEDETLDNETASLPTTASVHTGGSVMSTSDETPKSLTMIGSKSVVDGYQLFRGMMLLFFVKLQSTKSFFRRLTD